MPDLAPPALRGLGAAGTFAGAAGAASPSLPSGTSAVQPGDLLLMLVENLGTDAVPTVSGWTMVPSSDQVQGNTRASWWYRIATGSGDAPTIDDMGDHQMGRVVAVQAGTFDQDDIFNAVATNTQTATTSVSMPGLTTDRDFCMVFAGGAAALPDANSSVQFATFANADLTGLTEKFDNASQAGDGGAIVMAHGVKEAAGTVAATTCTAATNSERAGSTIAVNPNPGVRLRSIGAVAASAGAVTASAPAGVATGDLLIGFCESSGNVTLDGSSAAYTQIGGYVSHEAGTVLSVWYRVADGSDTFRVADSGDHQIVRLACFYGGSFNASDPFGASNEGTAAATTSLSFPTLTTDQDGALCIFASAAPLPDAGSTAEFSAWANSDLLWCDELIDIANSTGDGGAIGVGYGVDAVAGSVGATTATAATSAARNYLVFSINPVSALTHYTLDCDPGSFVITGVATDLLADRLIEASPGSFVVTGADMNPDIALDAQPGSYAVTGAAAGLLADRVMDAQPGAYDITGLAAVFDIALEAAPASFVITGFDATLEEGGGSITHYELNCEPGSFVISGSSAGLVADRMINASPGSFGVTGSPASLLAARVLNASAGAYAVTGAAASLLVARQIAAMPGTFVITGADVEFALEQAPSLQVQAVGDIVIVQPTGRIVSLVTDPEIIAVLAEGEINEVNAEGEVVLIDAEGAVWRL